MRKSRKTSSRHRKRIDYAADKALQEQEELKDRSQARKITKVLAGRRTGRQ